jgi:hypothetical protein
MPMEGAIAMLSVTVQICAAEFSVRMIEIGQWLQANQWEPTRYKYLHHEDAVLVTLDFPAEMAAEAFTRRFNGFTVYLRIRRYRRRSRRSRQAAPMC